MSVPSGMLMYPSSWAVPMTFTMLRPSMTTFLPYLQAELITCCTRSTLEAKVATMIRFWVCSAKIASKVFPTVRSDMVKPFLMALVESHIRAKTPFFPSSASLWRSVTSPNTGV